MAKLYFFLLAFEAFACAGLPLLCLSAINCDTTTAFMTCNSSDGIRKVGVTVMVHVFMKERNLLGE